MFVLAVAWLGDTSAYFAGRFLGKRKLYPAVSPKKTIEGAVGGLLAGTLAGWIAALTFASFLPPWAGAVCGFILSVASQLGDIVRQALSDSHSLAAGLDEPGFPLNALELLQAWQRERLWGWR